MEGESEGEVVPAKEKKENPMDRFGGHLNDSICDLLSLGWIGAQ